MEKFWGVSIAAGVVAFMAGLIFHARKLKLKRDEEIGQLAANNNWHYESKGQVFTLEGIMTNGVGWKIEPFDEEIVWRTESGIFTEELIFIGHSSSTIVVNYSSKGIRFLLNRLYSKDEAEKIATAKKVEIGDDAFSKDYVVIATDNYFALKVVTPDVQNLLISISHKEKVKQITLTRKGLEIKVDGTFPTAETIKLIVTLGETIVRNIRQLYA